MENRKILIDEYDAISEDQQKHIVQKYQCFTVTFHADGSEKDIPGDVEYRLRSGESLAVTDADHPDAPERFEISATHQPLRLLH